MVSGRDGWWWKCREFKKNIATTSTSKGKEIVVEDDKELEFEVNYEEPLFNFEVEESEA